MPSRSSNSGSCRCAHTARTTCIRSGARRDGVANASDVEQELVRVEATDASSIVLYLSGLSFMDTTGIRLPICADARSRNDGNRLALRRPPPPEHRVLRIAGIDDRLPRVLSTDPLAHDSPTHPGALHQEIRVRSPPGTSIQIWTLLLSPDADPDADRLPGHCVTIRASTSASATIVIPGRSAAHAQRNPADVPGSERGGGARVSPSRRTLVAAPAVFDPARRSGNLPAHAAVSLGAHGGLRPPRCRSPRCRSRHWGGCLGWLLARRADERCR